MTRIDLPGITIRPGLTIRRAKRDSRGRRGGGRAPVRAWANALQRLTGRPLPVERRRPVERAGDAIRRGLARTPWVAAREQPAPRPWATLRDRVARRGGAAGRSAKPGTAVAPTTARPEIRPAVIVAVVVGIGVAVAAVAAALLLVRGRRQSEALATESDRSEEASSPVVLAARPERAAPAWLRRLVTRRFNPIVVRLGFVGGRRSPWAYLEHVGRSSGRVYRTPVLPRLAGDHAYIPLPDGVDVNWARNVRSAGHCRIQVRGGTYELDEPTVIDAADNLALPPRLRGPLERRGARYLRLHVLASRPGNLDASRDAVAGGGDAKPERHDAGAESGEPDLTSPAEAG